MVVGKTRSFVFYTQKLIFDPKHLEKTLNTLLSQSMATKNPINRPKTQKSLKIKNLSELIFVF
jgi:hypothetical protein